MPAHVPSEARKSENGAGAEPCPPAYDGWSVTTVKPSKWASTTAAGKVDNHFVHEKLLHR